MVVKVLGADTHMLDANGCFVRIADLTTATSVCALMGMPRVLLSYLLIYQAAP
jgi:hypothetical protein